MQQLTRNLRPGAGRPTREQAELRREELLDRALELFLENGFELVTMEAIAAAVGMTKRTVYARYEDKCALFRDVYPLMVKYVGHDREELLREAEKVLVEAKAVKDGDIIVVSFGEPIGKAGGTNTMKIVKIGEHLSS